MPAPAISSWSRDIKREMFPKIEIRRDGAASREPLAGALPQIVAIASDRPADEKEPLPVFRLDAIAGMADFIIGSSRARSEMTAKLNDDCFVLDKDRIAHHEALAILKSRVRPAVESEEVPLAEAAGRFLAEALVSPRPIPAHDNAAVDGYAFAHSAYNKEEGARLIVAGEASAGHPFQAMPPPDSAVRIFTGAVMPSGLDTVVMQEDVAHRAEREMSVGCIFPPV